MARKAPERRNNTPAPWWKWSRLGKNPTAQPKICTENHERLWATKPHEATNFNGPVGFLELAASTMDSELHGDNDYC